MLSEDREGELEGNTETTDNILAPSSGEGWYYMQYYC